MTSPGPTSLAGIFQLATRIWLRTKPAEAEGWSEGLLGDVTNEPKRA